ncbi:DUF1801 domain-containing protein [Antrihabitans stalactiti]|uniref:YdhG-like domain-containing protein n=1 Tax=Antrihabitans stalactiti TaxID=2584121 RepID=A0A848KFC0_9NOCA|nr:DUF1801 domain-containing protein [Antrihabitans stalactiti]NMN95834.1 hypothetical protein [Antrihabitans stalactiti]
MSTDWRVARRDAIRSLIERADPEIVEEAKWRKASNPDGVPTFSLSGLICTLETYKDKVKVTFHKGSSLTDADGLFDPASTGVRRVIDLYEDDELDEDAFVALIREAVELNRATR